MAFCVVTGVLGGLWVDRQIGTVPLFIIAGVIVGAIAAFYGVYKLVVPLLREEKTRPKKGQDKDR